MEIQISRSERKKKKEVFLLLAYIRMIFLLIEIKDLRRFASHGQQRSAIISLKATQIQFYSRNYEKPILFLTIFFRVGRPKKKAMFFSFHEAQQVFITVSFMKMLKKVF